MNESIGKRIARLRKEKGMSQENLAEKIGVSAQAVSKWENDQSCPDISLLPPLTRLLGVTADELLTGETNHVQLLPKHRRKPLEELTLRVRLLSAEGDKIRVNLPMPLVKIAIEMGVDIGPQFAGESGAALKNIDMAKVMEMVEQGLIGKLVEMESADGSTVEVVVE